VFALTVAVGTASGLILEYQFGLNWSRLSVRAGDNLGPLMFHEVLAAFFLEAGFLGLQHLRLQDFQRQDSCTAAALRPVTSAPTRLLRFTYGNYPADPEYAKQSELAVGEPFRT
jgi:cytochrome bd-type quinol oxidase subunit 1